MVYTERAHFYNRFRMRGVRELVFYGLPAYAHFYVEMVNSLEGDGGALALFTELDRYKLDRVVGSARARKMTARGSGGVGESAPKTSFVFV